MINFSMLYCAQRTSHMRLDSAGFALIICAHSNQQLTFLNCLINSLQRKSQEQVEIEYSTLRF